MLRRLAGERVTRGSCAGTSGGRHGGLMLRRPAGEGETRWSSAKTSGWRAGNTGV